MSPNYPSHFTGYIAAWCIVAVWSLWLIVSRVANESGLTIYDLAAMRYGLAALIGAPLCLYYKPWRGLSFLQIALQGYLFELKSKHIVLWNSTGS